MREISVNTIKKVVKKLCIEANYYLPKDVSDKIVQCREEETWNISREVLQTIEENIHIAKEENIPLCQDTGMACIFIEIGQDVHIIGGSLQDSINEGIAEGYKEGYLRKSVVSDPIERINTGDNTPAVIYYNIVQGDKIKITVAPKGFGSENMSKIAMLKPAD